jgi:hypothetical protein
MTRRTIFPALLLVALSSAPCARARLESRCEWPYERRVSMNPANPAQQRHLRDDAETAETLAIRYADQRGVLGRMGHRQRTREQCEAVLWNAIAHVHQVTPEQVRQALRRQNDTPF